ncbi:MAG: 4'-phosphopantetheinyl transferase superfamily protein [Clostridia bacterium]
MLVTVSFDKNMVAQTIEKAVFNFCRIEGIPFAAPQIERERGKPIVTNLPIHISLTHSRQTVAVAVSFNPVGIDIEYKKSLDYKAIANRFFEIVPQSEDGFFALWTAKEAYAKALNIPLVSALKNTDYSRISALNILKDYALSVWGDKDIYIVI